MSSSKRLFSVVSPHGPGGVFFSWQRTSGGYLATTGYDQRVNIYNRHAEIIAQITLPGMCSCFGWDKDGDLLAIITDKSPNLVIWDAHNDSGREVYIDTTIRDPLNVLVWSKSIPILAIGSYRGNLLIYNHKISKRVATVMGKHNKSITCGAWSEANLLALGSEDRTLSISNIEGDTLRVATLRAEPSDVQFSEMKQDERAGSSGGGQNTVSLIVGGKTLYLFNLYDPENPIELAFQARYGSIQAYHWFGDGYILIGFSAGYFVAISTHMKEIGQELFQMKNHRDSLTGIAISTTISKAASCGDNTIKIHELHDLKDTSNVINIDDERGLDHIEWSEDGQLLAVSTSKGNLHVYLSKLPLVASACHSRVAYLTSLLEVTITSMLEGAGNGQSMTIAADIEPSFIALGPYHLALGMNNRAWFYLLGDATTIEFIKDREYLGTVQEIFLNGDYCAVRFEGKIQLHILEGEGTDGEVSEDRESRIFPDPKSGRKSDVISCHALTSEFLIYGTDMGGLVVFYLEDWENVHEFRHNSGIKELAPEPNGTKIVMVDVKANGHVYNPINDEITFIRSFPENPKKIMWDNSVTDKDVFVVLDGENVVHTFIIYGDDVEEGGTSCVSLGTTKIPMGQFPVLLFGGELSLQTQSGKLVKIMLSTHEISQNIHQYTNKELKEVIQKCVALGRFKTAWSICQTLRDNEEWLKLGRAAMKRLEIEFAIRVYREIGDVGMVWSLQELRGIEDKKLLSGHLALLLGDFSLAQNLYLQSNSPIESLNMRRDLLQWDQALHLANKLAPKETPFISKEYAQQLEFVGNYSEALAHYQRGIVQDTGGRTSYDNGIDLEEHNTFCQSGTARMSLRMGDLKTGLDICRKLKLKSLQKECAEILEQMKQLTEAALLYEAAGYYDKAAQLNIKLKNWQKIGQLLPHISSPKIQLQYAKAKEAEGHYRDAVVAYEAARDYDNAVRIHLDHLNNPEAAVRIVKENRSTEGAKLVARFFLKLGDFNSAIQFLILSRCVDEAFQLAQQHGKMDLFAQIIGDEATIQDYHSIAIYFEGERNNLQAGRFYLKAGEHSKALRHLLKCASTSHDDAEALNLAIEVVRSAPASQPHLTRTLIDFLMGETDGVPKDAKYLFRLYMARGQFKEAAKTAIIIAREEQSQGNYRNAHDVLFNMYHELLVNGIPVPAEMRSNLMILHSYILARLHIKRGDHLKGARMLLRVSKNISKFPKHVVPILTSTVIECQRSGLKNSAFSYAAILMRKEHSSELDPKYRKKIETIVRKQRPNPNDNEELPKLTGCPFCTAQNIPESDLYCSQCKSNLPYCVVTGFHVVATDLTTCHQCKFPGFRTEFLRLAQTGEPCPMCGSSLDVSLLVPVSAHQLEKASRYEDQNGTSNNKNGINGSQGSFDDLDEDGDYESMRQNSHPMSATSSSSGAGSSRPGSTK